jgi:DNA (cytosine-5)-methyltransferase 1
VHENERHYFSHNLLAVDIKVETILEQPKTDIIVATYPCTKYSAIAGIHGTRTGDDLFLHFFRHIAIERPETYVVWIPDHAWQLNEIAENLKSALGNLGRC